MTTPEALDAYLAVLRKHGALNFTMTSDGFQVNLEPLPPDEAPPPAAPGGWKTSDE